MKQLVLLVLAISIVACGDPPTDYAFISVSTTQIDEIHVVGQTVCPQELDAFVVTNESDEPVDVDIDVADVDGLDLIDFEDSDGLEIVDLFSIVDLQPGDSFETLALFNCADDQSFTTQISVSVGNDPDNPVFITVDLNIQ